MSHPCLLQRVIALCKVTHQDKKKSKAFFILEFTLTLHLQSYIKTILCWIHPVNNSSGTTLCNLGPERGRRKMNRKCTQTNKDRKQWTTSLGRWLIRIFAFSKCWQRNIPCFQNGLTVIFWVSFTEMESTQSYYHLYHSTELTPKTVLCTPHKDKESAPLTILKYFHWEQQIIWALFPDETNENYLRNSKRNPQVLNFI